MFHKCWCVTSQRTKCAKSLERSTSLQGLDCMDAAWKTSLDQHVADISWSKVSMPEYRDVTRQTKLVRMEVIGRRTQNIMIIMAVAMFIKSSRRNGTEWVPNTYSHQGIANARGQSNWKLANKLANAETAELLVCTPMKSMGNLSKVTPRDGLNIWILQWTAIANWWSK